MKLLTFLVCFALISCSRAPVTDPAHVYRFSAAPDSLTDHLDIGTLRMALERNLAAFDVPGSNVPKQFVFGDRVVRRDEYRRALEALRPELESFERFTAFVKANFEFYEVYGTKDWGEIFSTGYYDPEMQGSLKRTERFSRPLYRTPPDLVSIDVGAFAERRPGLEGLPAMTGEQKTRKNVWRGRYIAESRRVVPYYERSEIDGKQPLAGKGLELVWLEPVDAFFLEIQGSGVVDLPGGKRLRVGYDGQNGAPYVPIGKFLTDVIPLEQMSMQRIRRHLASVTPEERDAVLYKNPSYVFFKTLDSQSLTYSGAEVTAGRTIATDRNLFPKGVLSFFQIEEPTFASEGDIDPTGWENKSRFVFDQDTGGAIRGGGRVDLYMGQGPIAERRAGVMKREGKLWGLAPKAEFLQRLSSVAQK